MPVAKGSKKVADKVTNAEKAEKTKQENARFSAAMRAAINRNMISDIDELNTRAFYDKCGHALMSSILEAIDLIQRNELVDEAMRVDKKYNMYPESEYILLNEKLSVNTTKKRTVKTTTNHTTEPTKNRIRRKLNQQVDEPNSDEPEPVEAEEVQESTPTETTDSTETKDTADKKEKTKGNVTQINRNAKTWLGFIVARFVAELDITDGGKGINTDDDFTKFVLKNTNLRDLKTQISRTIIPTVNRLKSEVSDTPDHGFSLQVSNAITSYFKDRSGLVPLITGYIVNYFKLLGHTIAQQLWTVHKGVNAATIESAMRILNTGNNHYLVSEEFCQQEEYNFGIEHGLLYTARSFDVLLNPPPTEEEKKERADKLAKSRGKKTKSTEATNDKEADDKDEEEEEEDAEAEDVEVEYEEDEEPAKPSKPSKLDKTKSNETSAKVDTAEKEAKPAEVKQVRKLTNAKK